MLIFNYRVEFFTRKGLIITKFIIMIIFQMMKVLVVNNGSTSLRFCLYDISKNIELASFNVENIGSNNAYYKYQNYKLFSECKKTTIESYKEAFDIMISYLLDSNNGVITSLNEIIAIGHRVVHGGEKYTHATLIDEKVLKDISDLAKFAPLHNKKSKEIIELCQREFKGILNVAVFDTAFHLTMPKENFLYAIPLKLYEEHGIRKYGFHGISYNYVLNRYSDIIEEDKENINTIICHLGGGSSICSIKNGVSFDTTMEFTPLSGLIMATRSGSIDPGIIPIIQNVYNCNIDEAIEILNKESGYYAITGLKGMKEIVDKSLEGDNNAIFLRKMINNNFKKHLLSMMANLEKVDSLIMSGTIGSKNKEQREMLLGNLEFFGLKLDYEKNNLLFNQEGIISDISSKIPIYVIPTNENLEIANQCVKVLKKR